MSLADLTRANLSKAEFVKTIFVRTTLESTNWRNSRLHLTVFSDVDLSSCKYLDTCTHTAPSSLDVSTLQQSGSLPLQFLRGAGLPDMMIEYLPSLLGTPIRFYSCFISYSAKDSGFAARLHADLQAEGVRCWFAPEDMKIGAKILDTIDDAIRLRDKLLLVLSESSIASGWVEDEVTKAFSEERQRGGTVLFPIRIDDSVFAASEAWAVKLRNGRNIGDFREWKKHGAYRKAFVRLLRDLKPSE
jgi:hypothetical protein